MDNKKICSHCGVEFDSKFETDDTCPNCVEMIIRQEMEIEENRWVQVTREMALDAGEPSLEGQWIKW